MAHEKYKDIGKPITILKEECAETIVELGKLIKTACKIERFGWMSHNPLADEFKTNIDLLREEISDVLDSFSKIQDQMNDIEKRWHKENK